METTISTELLKKLLTAANDFSESQIGFDTDMKNTLDSLIQEVDTCIRRKSFNIQLFTTANLTSGVESVSLEYKVTPLTDKTADEIAVDCNQWKIMCVGLKEEEPETDDAYAMLFEELGYKVETIEFGVAYTI